MHPQTRPKRRLLIRGAHPPQNPWRDPPHPALEVHHPGRDLIETLEYIILSGMYKAVKVSGRRTASAAIAIGSDTDTKRHPLSLFSKAEFDNLISGLTQENTHPYSIQPLCTETGSSNNLGSQPTRQVGHEHLQTVGK